MKLPVLKAVGAGLAYLTTHFGAVLKALWLPTLLMMAVFAYVMPPYFQAMIEISSFESGSDPQALFAAMGPAMKWMGLLYLSMAILYPMMIAGVLRHIVRGESPKLPFYFQFLGDEVRILFTFILLMIMLLIIYLVGVLGVAALTAALALLLKEIGGMIAGVIILAVLIAAIWFLLRMSMALPAAVGARRIGLAVSWSITKGNSWRLFFYWLIWGLIMAAIGCVYVLIAMPDYFSAMGEMVANANDPSAQQELQRRLLQAESNLWDRSQPGFWIIMAATYVYMIVYTALMNVSSGVAYRYLAGEK
jgi:hypothetical protein